MKIGSQQLCDEISVIYINNVNNVLDGLVSHVFKGRYENVAERDDLNPSVLYDLLREMPYILMSKVLQQLEFTVGSF
jgi:hypothetical protein